MKKFLLGAALAAASLIATASSAQAPTYRDVVIQPNFLQGSCVAMMQGWENGHSVQAQATIGGVTLTNSGNRRMLALTKNDAGQVWSIADLQPGQSVNVGRMNGNTKVAWAMFGGRHHCMREFIVGTVQNHTF